MCHVPLFLCVTLDDVFGKLNNVNCLSNAMHMHWTEYKIT